MKTGTLQLDELSDDALLARLADLVTHGRRVEAELIWHLAEVDARRLYLREACPSMHAYATHRLHLSEAEAYLRITVARVSRRFPIVLRMLADGRLHVSSIAKLAPHLREENVDALLASAVHRSKRDIEAMVAELAPKPDVLPSMRRLPVASKPAPGPTIELRPGGVDEAAIPAAASAAPTDAPAAAAAAPVARSPAVVVLIAPARYKVQFTAGAELHDKIARAQALLRHRIPDGDLAAVFDRAMTLLVRELERERFAATKAPRKEVSDVDPTPTSRYIPAPVRRAVWERDGGQCTFRDRQGRRCPARERLEFHHLIPFAQGGDHGAANVTLRCRMHNAYQAKLDYGADLIEACQKGLHSGHPSSARRPGAAPRTASRETGPPPHG